jgi:TetR/AcrR family transcriptional regulator
VVAASRLTPRAERTRQAILRAAEELFAERGLARTRLEDVAEAVGIRRASIVYYFRDKPDLYDAVLADVLGGFHEQLAAALTPAGALSDRIEAAVSAWVDYIATRPSLARLLLREVADATPSHPPALQRHIRPFFSLIQQLLREHKDDPLASAPPIDAVHLASTIAGATVFFVAAMPALLQGSSFDPLDARQIESHKSEILEITRRLLGIRRHTRRKPRVTGARGVKHVAAP